MKTYNKPNAKLLSLNIKKSVLEDDVPILETSAKEPIDVEVNQSQFNDAIDDFMK